MSETSRSLAWYHRAGVDPWQMSVCDEHAAAIAALGFRPGVHPSFASIGEPNVCAFCRRSLTIDEVRACRCNDAGVRCPVHRREPGDEREERQRTWSIWLDEVAGPGTGPLMLKYEDDRDEMARLVAEVVADVPADAAGARCRSVADGRERRGRWRDWFVKVPPLELELGDDRERLAALLTDAVPSAPTRGAWRGWATIPPAPRVSAINDDELRARVEAVAATAPRAARMVLRYLTRNAIDLVREGATRCADSVVAFAGMFKTAETAAVFVPTIAARLGVTVESFRSFLDDSYEREVERALDPHVECSIHDGDNCGAADCPPAIALRARAAQKQGAWSRLELRRDGGGHRHYLDGEPVHCGEQLELQATADRSDDYGEYEVPLPEGVTVRYEASLHDDEVSVTLHKYVGNHEFVTRMHAGMRFRWPGRTN